MKQEDFLATASGILKGGGIGILGARLSGAGKATVVAVICGNPVAIPVLALCAVGGALVGGAAVLAYLRTRDNLNNRAFDEFALFPASA